MVVVEPPPTGHSRVVIVHDPLQAFDVSISKIVDLVRPFFVLELELLLHTERKQKREQTQRSKTIPTSKVYNERKGGKLRT
jgi:hypothetical protein